MMDYRGRTRRLAAELNSAGLDGFLTAHLANVRYLCGFTGSNGVLAVAGKKRAFFTDGRYTEQAKEQVVGARVMIAKSAAVNEAAKWLERLGAAAVGFESEHVTVAQRQALGRAAPKLKWRGLSGTVEALRMVKEPAEIVQIRTAVELASRVFDAVVQDIRPGMAETAVAAEIEYLCRRMGAEGMSFDTLVAAGKRSALPHGVASEAKLPARGFVVMDFGVIVGGYCSDMTRTVYVGKPDNEARRIYGAVLRAQLAGIKSVKAGVETAEVDYAARKVLQVAGLAGYFTHSTGHGVGLEIHEPPGLRKRPAAENKKNKPERLAAGMVVTIEPGVYIPGTGGVRIEDMVVVTESGCEVLTPTSKEMLAIH